MSERAPFIYSDHYRKLGRREWEKEKSGGGVAGASGNATLTNTVYYIKCSI